jgi:O-antigen ligase
MGNPNGLGMLCQIFFAFFTIVITQHKNLFPKQEIILVYALIFISVILSGSRNTIFTIFIFYAFYRFFKVSYFMGFVVMLLLAVVNQLVIANLPEIMTALGLQEYMRVEHIEEGSGRIIAWRFAWEQIQANPFVGNGMNYEVWLFKKFEVQLGRLGHIGNSHNSWLATWLNTGAVGLALFAYALVYRFVKLARETAFGLPLMYSLLFSATFEAWLVGSLNVMVPFMLLIWSYFESVKLRAAAPLPALKPYPA